MCLWGKKKYDVLRISCHHTFISWPLLFKSCQICSYDMYNTMIVLLYNSKTILLNSQVLRTSYTAVLRGTYAVERLVQANNLHPNPNPTILHFAAVQMLRSKYVQSYDNNRATICWHQNSIPTPKQSRNGWSPSGRLR